MLKSVSFCITLYLILPLLSGERVRYDNYHVYEITPNSTDDLEILSELQSLSDSLTFLNDPLFVGKPIYAVVAPHKQPDFTQVLNLNEIQYELKEKNLQRLLNIEMEQQGRATTDQDDYNWKLYHTLDKTYNWLRSLAKKYPEQVEVLVGGQTYEGREILGVKVSYKKGNKGVFIEGGIHAREWISSATVTYILNQLLTSDDPEVRDLAENYDWYIFPHFNPDGYVYTHERVRLWRKTRSRNGFCYGVDANRNWNFHWDEVGTSSNPCAETYSGQKAFSEIETRTLSEFINSLKGEIITYISFHSYSQLLLFPYGHTHEHTKNHDDLQEIGNAAAKALKKRYGTTYTVGNVYDTIYPAAGSSMDWAYGIKNIPLSFTYELRPNSNSWGGFILPARQIIPTGEETLDSIIALIKQANKLNYFNKNL